MDQKKFVFLFFLLSACVAKTDPSVLLSEEEIVQGPTQKSTQKLASAKPRPKAEKNIADTQQGAVSYKEEIQPSNKAGNAVFIEAWQQRKITLHFPSLSADGKKLAFAFCTLRQLCALLVNENASNSRFFFPPSGQSWTRPVLSASGEKLLFQSHSFQKGSKGVELAELDLNNQEITTLLPYQSQISLGAANFSPSGQLIFLTRAYLYPDARIENELPLFSLFQLNQAKDFSFLMPSSLQPTAFTRAESLYALDENLLLLGLAAPKNTEINGKDWQRAITRKFPGKNAIYQKLLPYLFRIDNGDLDVHPIGLDYVDNLVVWAASGKKIVAVLAQAGNYHYRLFDHAQTGSQELFTISSRPVALAVARDHVLIWLAGKGRLPDMYRYNFEKKNLRKHSIEVFLDPLLKENLQK